MKPDERALLLAVAAKGQRHVRDVVPESMPWKRVRYILLKWAGRGWYDYGVSFDLGWLTAAGRRAAEESDP